MVESVASLEGYQERGYACPIRALSPEQVTYYRGRLEAFEASQGGPLKGALKQKPHLLLTWLDELVRNDAVLDVVEGTIGPNILCWASGFFTKEANDPGYVSWHQDLTYWGLDPADIVTAWIALSPSTPESGCMRVIPGSHRQDVVQHTDTFAENNMLSRGQEVDVDVDEAEAVDLVLQPGEMSLHHVKLIHGSGANRANDRRIGYAVRYVPTYVRQTAGAEDSAMLVRGRDDYHHFLEEARPRADMDEDAVAQHAAVTARAAQILYRGTDRQTFR